MSKRSTLVYDQDGELRVELLLGCAADHQEAVQKAGLFWDGVAVGLEGADKGGLYERLLEIDRAYRDLDGKLGDLCALLEDRLPDDEDDE